MKRVAIIGAGLSGLSLGYLLKKKKYHVDIFEREPTAGGYAGSLRSNGFIVERGPNSFLDNDKAFISLVDELGLKKIPANSHSKNRFLYHGKSIHKIPLSPSSLLSSKLMTFGQKFSFMSSLLKNTSEPTASETVFDFLQRQFGAAAADKLGRPMIVGIFGGDAKKLAVAEAFPKWLELEKTHGSLFKGMRASSNGRPQLFTFPGGSGDLVQALESKLKGSLHLNERAMGMSANKNVRTPKRFESYEHVVFCGSWSALAQIQTPASQEPELKTVSQATAPVVSLSFAVKGPSPINGFGMLIHPDEGFKTLGILCPSEIFPERAPQGYSLLTLIMGGSFFPQLASRPEAEIVQTAKDELNKIFGHPVNIERYWCFKWPEGITQYTQDTTTLRKNLTDKIAASSGLIIHSHAFGGVSVADCIRKSYELAEKI